MAKVYKSFDSEWIDNIKDDQYKSHVWRFFYISKILLKCTRSTKLQASQGAEIGADFWFSKNYRDI